MRKVLLVGSSRLVGLNAKTTSQSEGQMGSDSQSDSQNFQEFFFFFLIHQHLELW